MARRKVTRASPNKFDHLEDALYCHQSGYGSLGWHYLCVLAGMLEREDKDVPLRTSQEFYADVQMEEDKFQKEQKKFQDSKRNKGDPTSVNYYLS